MSDRRLPGALRFCGHGPCLDRFRHMLWYRKKPKVFCIMESEDV
jgi:hypothetical protein